jgi:hypothetical protein
MLDCLLLPMAARYTSWPSFCAPTETERCRFGEVVGKPSISADASGSGFEICMYGISEGFASRPSLELSKTLQKILIFFEPHAAHRVEGRVTCETRGSHRFCKFITPYCFVVFFSPYFVVVFMLF